MMGIFLSAGKGRLGRSNGAMPHSPASATPWPTEIRIHWDTEMERELEAEPAADLDLAKVAAQAGGRFARV